MGISAISAMENNDTDNVVSEVEDTNLEKTINDPISVNESSSTAANTTGTAKNTTTPKKAKVSAPVVYNVFKKKGYFKITVKDSNKKPIKNLKLKVKVFTGKKYKTYTLKTNSKGIATLNTKKLKKGTHKVLINSKNKNYNITKKSYIHIGIKKTMILRISKTQNFRNGDYFRFFKETKNGQYQKGVYVENLRVHKGSLKDAKSHFIIKVKYTFKNIKGITIKRVSKDENMFRSGLIIGYEPITVKIWYLKE